MIKKVSLYAYNSSGEEIYSGSTTTTLTGTNDSLTIPLSPVDSGEPILFPIIQSITRPAEIVHDTDATFDTFCVVQV